MFIGAGENVMRDRLWSTSSPPKNQQYLLLPGCLDHWPLLKAETSPVPCQSFPTLPKFLPAVWLLQMKEK